MPHVPASPFTLSLPVNATIDVHADKTAWLVIDRKRYAIEDSPGIVAAMRSLKDSGATEEELRDRVVELDGDEGLSSLYRCLLLLSAEGLIRYSVRVGTRPLMTAITIAGEYRPTARPPDPEARFIASRSAFLRRDGAALVLESPISLVQIVVSDWRGAAILAAFANASTIDAVGAIGFGLDEKVLAACVELLRTAGFIVPVDSTGVSEEDRSRELNAWEFHDLVFHSRSRRGRHRNPYGATYPLRGSFEPLPAIKPQTPDSVIPLFRPDIEHLRTADEPFTSVLERRRSERHHSETPLTDKQLGEFLYRACRIRRVIPAGTTEPYEGTNRVYPSGGAIYPLEVYLVVRSCEPIGAGLYHYRGDDHAIERMSPRNEDTDALLRSAAYAAASSQPQVLIVLAARMQRVAWKYSSIAYATILKDVGVLYQTMYLVATAIGLAGCALGGGNADVFARASGLPYWEESSVGEFMLGTAVKGKGEQGTVPSPLTID